MINIALGGANGRVSKLIIEAIKTNKDFQLSAEVLGMHHKSSIHDIKKPVDVFIDFSVPEALEDHLNVCVEKKYRMVIGVTGYTETQKKQIIEASSNIPIVFAPNMSVGVNLSYQFLSMAAKVFGETADIAILDIHNKHKKDAPSGTALQMAACINKVHGKTTENSNITFSSLRLADAIAESTAIFAVEGERLEITHRAINRSLFATGALKAAKWIMSQKSGLYDMQAVLGFEN